MDAWGDSKEPKTETNEHLVMDILRELHAGGHTIVIVTHDPEIGLMAQRRIRLEHGKVAGVETGPYQCAV